jgi:hypothetical protein
MTDKQPQEGSAEPLAERVLDWLEKQGYPLEFRTARAFQDAGFGVRQGTHYRPEEGPPREIDVIGDVIAERGESFLRIAYYVECKYTKGRPWVVLSSRSASMAPSACIAQSQGNDLVRSLLWCLAGDRELHQLSLFSTPRVAGFGGQQAFNDKGKDQFYAAMQGAIDATQGRLRASEPRSDETIEESLGYGHLGLPLIVLDGDLFEASWDESQARMRVEARNHVRLHWQGASKWQMRATVDVVTSQGLPEFLDTARDDVNFLVPKLFAGIEEIRECLRVGSMDPLTVLSAARGTLSAPGILWKLRKAIEERATDRNS